MRVWLGSAFAFGLLGVAAAQQGWIACTPSAAPPARGFHALAYDIARGVSVLFGGFDGNVYLADTWEWDGLAWTQRAPAIAPSPRLGHAMAYDIWRGRVVLFGGAVGSSGGTDDDQTWEWDGVTWWQLQPPVRPSPRRGANMAFDPVRGVCVLFGGGVSYTGSPVLDDTWEWNGSTWTQYAPPTRPPARWSAFLAADWAGSRVVLTGGGVGLTSQLFADTWAWNGSVWQQLTPVTLPTARRYGAAAFDVHRGLFVTWGGVIASGGTDASAWVSSGTEWRRDPRPFAPSARWATAAAYDLLRERTMLFGGYDGSTMRDTWEYDAGPLATSAPSGPGCAGAMGVPSLASFGGAPPALGTTWTLRLGYGTAGAAAARAIGFSDQTWLGGALPFDLGALGMPGCTWHTSTDWVGGLALVNGIANASLALPSSPAFAGLRLFAQGLALEPGINQLGAIVSNALAATTGPF